jgi:Rad3-related DNA helicase
MPIVRINIPSKNPLPDMWEEIRPDFPMPSPRKYQDDALSVIYWALENDDFDNIVIQAPTGIGKSAIAMTVQNRFQSAYLMTPSLGLTEQYRSDYPHKLKEVRGRANFPCWVRSGNASGAPCYGTKKSCPHTKREDPCPYYEQKFAAVDSRLTLSNPAYMFRVIQGNSSFGQREFAIIDEAHNLESFFMDLLEVRISTRDWQSVNGARTQLPMAYSPADWKIPIENLANGAKRLIEFAEQDEDDKALDRARQLLDRCSTFLELLQTPKRVVVETKSEPGGRVVIAKPIRVNRFAADRLEMVAQKRIFLSATILNCETFLKNLGLENQKTLYVNVNKSPFASENFNIVYAPCGPMSYGKRDNSLKKQIKALAAIMDKKTNKRGVVLPHSHYIRKTLVEGLTDLGYGDRIITHDGNSNARKHAIDHFFNSPRDDLVLISTYVGEGFDFKGTLAEWLVIAKIPFLPIKGSAQIELRMAEDEHSWRAEHENTPACPYEEPNKYSNGLCSSFSCPKPCQSWYQLQTALKLVQGAGRIIRTADDKGDLFILDGSWARWHRMNAHLLPSWFKNSIRDMPPWLKRHIA